MADRDERDLEMLYHRSHAIEARPGHLDSLCTTCSNSHIIRRRGGEVMVKCGYLAKMVPPDIMECTKWQPRNAMTLEEMQDIALPVDVRHGVNDGSYR